MNADLYNNEAKKIGTVELPDRLFGRQWNPDLVHQAVRIQTANRRKVLAHAKTRAEVRGGGKKPWRQKGLGRARHGSIRSPIWKGGGVTHGPLREKIFKLKFSKKMRQGAIFSAFSRRLKDGEVKIIDNFKITEPRTKLVSELAERFSDKKTSMLIIPNTGDSSIYQASRNVQGVKSIDPRSLNTYDILRYKNIVLEKGAIEKIDKHYNAVK